jgi:large subunit ribosomal protein L30e
MADEISLIKKLLKTKQLIIGTERTIKKLKTGRLEKVFLAKNCPDETRTDAMYYAELSKTPVIELEQESDELGTVCKKPFQICMLSIEKLEK